MARRVETPMTAVHVFTFALCDGKERPPDKCFGGSEQWRALDERNPWTTMRENERWRANARLDEGRVDLTAVRPVRPRSPCACSTANGASTSANRHRSAPGGESQREMHAAH